MTRVVLIYFLLISSSLTPLAAWAQNEPTPPPTLTDLFPTFVTAGSEDFSLILNGQNFNTETLVNFGGFPVLRPASVTPSQLRVIVPSSYVDRAGSFAISVTNPPPGGGMSSQFRFTVIRGAQPGVDPGVNRPPILVSVPLATPNPARVGELVAFSVSATDPDNDVVIVSWDFGDGFIGFGPAPSHAYLAPGIYGVNVTLSDGSATSGTSLSVAVNPLEEPGSEPIVTDTFGVSSAAVQFNFKPERRTRHDSLSLSGSIPVEVGFEPNGKTVTLVMGDLTREFTLGANGRSADRAFTLSGTMRRGAYTASSATFTIRLKNETLFPLLQSQGFFETTGKGNVDVPVIVLLNGVAQRVVLTFRYRARENVRGTGRD